MRTYQIPLKYKEGKFQFNELDIDEIDGSLDLDYDTEYQMLEYTVPVYKEEAVIYKVPQNLMPNGLTVVYDNSGQLDRVQFSEAEWTRLVYIRFTTVAESEEAILKFVKEQADKLCAKIIGRKQKLARLFFGTYSCGGASIQIAAVTGTAEEMQAVIDEYHGDYDAADNSGNYPIDTNMIMLDDEPLGVMLMCSHPDSYHTLFHLAAAAVEEQIKTDLLNKIDKTDDFQFIIEEWD